MMKSLLRIMLYIAVGGGTFWLVDISVNLALGHELFSFEGVVARSLFLPVTAVSFHTILNWFFGRESDAPSIAIFMLIGVWFLGPTCYRLVGIYGDWHWVAVSTVNPMNTWIMSTFSGGLVGLCVTSIALPFMHLIFERGRWVLPLKDRGLLPLP